MRNNWLFFIDLDGGSPNIYPIDSLVPHAYGAHFLSQITSFVDNSSFHPRFLNVPGSLALQEALGCFSKFAGALFLWFANGSNNAKSPGNSRGPNSKSCKSSTIGRSTTSTGHNFKGFRCNYGSRGKYTIPLIFSKISNFTFGLLGKEAGQLQSFPLLSLTAAVVSPLGNISHNVVDIPLENSTMGTQSCMDPGPCDVENQRSGDLSISSLNWTRCAVEPRTGIEFPIILDDIIAGENSSSLISEVLVGTGSRIMTIVKIKSLKVYAFGFYVHPYDVCQKLGPKYASIPIRELNKCQDFYEDLLREDINMTVRLVVGCNGIKINTVRDAFEKSLRARLIKTNPDTDYQCLKTLGSMFPQDIHLGVGTKIDFRRTADGHLITEIGGNQIGTVHSKDLCRAFFGMYIGDIPVSEQTKEEIGTNVANIIRRY